MDAYEKQIEEMAKENERLLFQSRAEKIELESRLNMERTWELLEQKQLGISEKGNLDKNVAELQTKLGLIVSEKGLLNQENRELSNEAECLRA